MTEEYNWFNTFSGEKIYYDKPEQNIFDLLSLKDIANSLSNQARFMGHISRFYSVAEHSNMVSNNVEQQVKESIAETVKENHVDLNTPSYYISLMLAGLLHDAKEAYISDMISPFKSQFLDNNKKFKDFENLISKKIYLKFIPNTDEKQVEELLKSHIVYKADLQLLVDEREALTNYKGEDDWLADKLGYKPNISTVRVIESRINYNSYIYFIDRYKYLTSLYELSKSEFQELFC